jgi:hypothetical protein
MGINRMVLETDCLSLKLALENDSFKLAEAGGRLYELKTLATGSFSNYLCSFVPRVCDDVRWDVTRSLLSL